jgi:IPT/TIG domain
MQTTSRAMRVAFAATLFLFGARMVSAQTVTQSVIGSGGATAGNDVVQITGTIGQPAIGPIAGAAQSADLGFWATTGRLLALPQITTLTPTAGDTAGGTTVYVNGFNFTSGAAVRFDTGDATLIDATQNRLTVITPAHAAGLVDLSVAVNTNTAVKPSAYTYMVSATTDTDGDGMTDACELRYSLDPLNPADAAVDADSDARTNLDECLAGTHPRGFYKSYLAEGASNAFFSTRFALLNPGIAPATTVTEFLMPDGTVLPNPARVAARTRATQDAASMPNAPVNDFSTIIESDFPLIADRTMTWDANGYGSHAETAVSGPAQDWYLAEGATHGRFDLFYLLQNPGGAPADVTVTYLRPAFGPPIVKMYSVGAHSRRTIWVDQEDPELAAIDVSAAIHATQPIVVERSMYLTNPGEPFAAGTAGVGATTIGTRWFLAEGATGSFFDMYVLIGNPSATDATAQVTYLLSTGQNITKSYTVHAQSRFTISVKDEDPALADAAVSVVVDSGSVPVVVERAMWWPAPGNWYEAHSVLGSQTTGTHWALADGEEGGTTNVQTYVLIANTSAFAGTARVTLLFEDGTSAVQDVSLPASSRVNVPVGATFPQAAGKRFGVEINSLGDTPCQIVVERAMYSDANGVVWAAGTAALGTKLP